LTMITTLCHILYKFIDHIDNNNLQAFQLIVLARYLLGVPGTY